MKVEEIPVTTFIAQLKNKRDEIGGMYVPNPPIIGGHLVTVFMKLVRDDQIQVHILFTHHRVDILGTLSITIPAINVLNALGAALSRQVPVLLPPRTPWDEVSEAMVSLTRILK